MNKEEARILVDLSNDVMRVPELGVGIYLSLHVGHYGYASSIYFFRYSRKQGPHFLVEQ